MWLDIDIDKDIDIERVIFELVRRWKYKKVIYFIKANSKIIPCTHINNKKNYLV